MIEQTPRKTPLWAILGGLLALSWTPATPAVAQNFDLDEIVQVSVLPGWRMNNGRHMAAVRITLLEGWYTYWRQPGDSGIPPQFEWGGSQNLDELSVHFPSPEVIRFADSSSLGYHDEVVFPLEATPTIDGGAIRLTGTMQIGVCEEVCLPASFKIDVALPNAGGSVAMIARSLNARPRTSDHVAGCQVAAISDGLRIAMRLPADKGRNVQRVVIETADPTVWVSRPTQVVSGGHWISEAELVPADGKPFALARSDVRMTLFRESGAVEYLGCSAY